MTPHRQYIFFSFFFWGFLVSPLALAREEPNFPVEHEKTIVTYTINSDGTYIEEFEELIQIATSEGVKERGQVAYAFKWDLEKISVVEAYTLQPDGKRITVPAKSIKTTETDYDSKKNIFSNKKYKTIIYPEVKVGSLLYRKLRITRHTPYFANHFFKYFEFPLGPPPYKHYEINLIYSDKMPLRIEAMGPVGGLISPSKGYKKYRYVFSQTEIEPEESGEVDSVDYSPYLAVSSFSDYQNLSETLGKAFQAKSRITPAIKKLADTITKDIETPKDQAKALYYWVGENIRYVGTRIGNGSLVPHTAEEILKNHYGDCKDHALMLEVLLRAKGIESTAALINMGKAYKFPNLPVIHPTNHVITYIPSMDLYLDPTNQYAPFGELSSDLLDKPTLLLSLGKIGHTPRMLAANNHYYSDTRIKIAPDGKMNGVGTFKATGSGAMDFRSYRVSELNDDPQKSVSVRLEFNSESGSGDIISTSPLDLEKPYEEYFSFEIEAASNFPGPAAMRIPLGPSFAYVEALPNNRLFKSIHHPFVCESKIVEAHYSIEFPSNIKILRTPEDVNFENGGHKYTSNYRLENTTLKVTRSYESDRPSMVCNPSDNETRNAFYDALRKDQMGQVIYQ